MQEARQTVSQLGTILGVWAHPDDETFSMAGLMCLAAKNGQEVACITATRGEAGIQDTDRWPAETLGLTRQKELEAAFECIGVRHHHWLDYQDGKCREADQTEAAAKVGTIIDMYKPDTVITFPPDGLTGHDDHRAVSAWTRQALELSGCPAKLYYTVETTEVYEGYLKQADEKFDIFFNVDEPIVIPEADCDLVLRLPEEALECKIRALRLMPSQTARMFADKELDWMHDGLRQETFVLSDRDIDWN
jgi:LmbE family N-acetylglucosaminyl deacetylase